MKEMITVFFLAAAWWNALSDVFFPGLESGRLYAGIFCASVLAALLCRKLRAKSLLFVFPAAAAWILISGTPDGSGYDAFFLSMPVLEIWFLALAGRRLKPVLVLTAVLPFAAAAIAGRFPGFWASWLLAGALLLALSAGSLGGAGGKAPGRMCLQLLLFSAVFCLLAGGAALAGKSLDRARDPEGGFYRTARREIRETVIGTVEEAVNRITGRDEERAPQGAAESAGAENSADLPDSEAEREDPDGQTEAEAPGDRAEAEESGEMQALSGPDGIRTEGMFNSASVSTGSAMDDLRSIGSFVPDESEAFHVVVREKPEGTVYFAEQAGTVYNGDFWEGTPAPYLLSSADAGRIWDGIRPEDCMDYPEDLSRLEELCRGWETGSLDEVSRGIDRALAQMAVYDTEPGPTPRDQDFAEYFLFENHRGFCVHFATAAALLYRMCGYPSRYVQGYAVPASAFEELPNGDYTALVDGTMGHAWCQVYDAAREEWTDLEHTPPSAGSPERRTPGAGEVFLTRRTIEKIEGAGTALAVLAALAALFFLQAAVRRRRLRRRMLVRREGRGILTAYRCIILTLRLEGSGAGGDGKRGGEILPPDPETEAELKARYPELSGEEWEWICRTALETLFYRPPGDRESTARMYRLYRKFSRSAEERLTKGRRIIRNYIRCLG